MQEKLKENGFIQIQLALPAIASTYIKNQDWNSLDTWLSSCLKPKGLLHLELSKFIVIKETEHIISIREDGDDEDGIWHDDGSREMAFTLSLTQEKIQGGILQFKNKASKKVYEISTPKFGVLTVFLTGIHGYEHRVLRVTQGKRIICAGWIN